MYWGIGVLGIVLYVVLGILCWRKGHRLLFVIGIFMTLLWLIGAVIPPKAQQA